ncbi:MAG: hypothetical protein J7L82_02010 [Staphylothermus sp.]|nr:hypothetical protein [Staphylothermus sp.]
MAKGKTSNANQKAHYSTYKSEERQAKNKISRLERHVLKCPNDEQAGKAFNNLVENGVPYTRNRKSLKPNSTVQRRVRRVNGLNTTFNTFYAEIVPKVPEYAIKKESK